jgi:hypothetical protein
MPSLFDALHQSTRSTVLLSPASGRPTGSNPRHSRGRPKLAPQHPEELLPIWADIVT